MGLETGREIIDDALVYMLPKLKRLEDLDLHTSIGSTDTIEQICIMQIENKLGIFISLISFADSMRSCLK